MIGGGKDIVEERQSALTRVLAADFIDLGV